MSETSGTETSGNSFSSSTGGSSLASDNTDTRALNNLQEDSANGEGADEIDSNNRSFTWEWLFATLYTLTKNRTFDTSLRIAVLRVVLEFLQMFRMAFNSSFPWAIDQELWIFKAIKWVLIRFMVVEKGYATYIGVFYFLAGLIFANLLLSAWVAVGLKGDDAANAWLRRGISCLQLVGFLVYSIAWPAILDYLVFLFDCKWTNISQGLPPYHVFFVEQSCVAMPHLAHMLFAGVTCIVFAAMVLLMLMGSCDMNPMNRSLLASSDAITSLKILVLKIIFVVVSCALDQFAGVQAVLMLIAIWGVVYYTFESVPFYRPLANIVWAGLWLEMLAVTLLLAVLQLMTNQHSNPLFAITMTSAVLDSIFPSVLTGSVIMGLRLRHIQHLSKLLHRRFDERRAEALSGISSEGEQTNLATSSRSAWMMRDLKSVYRFRDARQVSILSRGMRKWDQDGVPDQMATDFGEFVLRCGMARMPNNAALLVLYANFLIEVRKDGQTARTQLQLAQKASPSVLDTFNIFVAQQLAKSLKRDRDGLDLLSYVEFQRNYRSCVRAHRLALMAQRQWWTSLLRDAVSFKGMQESLRLMEQAEQRATLVYRKALERYPGNGKVMKIYARFLEFVRSEPGVAARFYEAAAKQGTTESLLALTAGENADLSAAGSIDEKVDGIVIINAQGSMLMVNAAAVALFGYEKGELEGKNVSVLMPMPFSLHHNSFLQRYVESGQPHILNKTRSMVALRKDRAMLPISLCVVRLSGAGADTLFMGIVRPDTASSDAKHKVVKFWTTSDGIVLCADSSATDTFGIPPDHLLGRNFSNICTDAEAVNKYFTEAAKIREGSGPGMGPRELPMFKTQVMHGFLPPVAVELSMEFGGAVEGGDFRSVILHARVLSEASAVMVLDQKGRLIHVTARLSELLGYPGPTLLKMDLNSLLPQPYCQIHAAWFKDPPERAPPTSCRAGGVVHLLSANGTKLPVVLTMSNREDMVTGQTTHVVQVNKATEENRLDQQRMLLSINHKGIVLNVNPGVPKSLFGFDASELVGQPLASVVDIFGAWRTKFHEDASLLTLLSAGILEGEGADVCRGASSGCMAWRVGVVRPLLSKQGPRQQGPAASSGMGGEQGADGVTAGAQGSSLLAMLQHQRPRAACMKLELLENAVEALEGLRQNAAAAETTPLLQVSLHRSDALTAVIELDKHLAIARADEIAVLMFGVSGKQLHGKSFARLMGLPSSTQFDDLLGSKEASKKKGGIKSSTAGPAASRIGSIMHISTRHLGDGAALSLSMHAMSYQQSGKPRMIVRVQLKDPVSAALDQLLAMKEGRNDATAAAALASQPRHAHGPPDDEGSCHSHSISQGSIEDVLTRRTAAGPTAKGQCAVLQGAEGQHSVPRDRTRDWVREASRLPSPDDSNAEAQQAGKQQQGGPFSRHPGDCDVAVHAVRKGRSAQKSGSPVKLQVQMDDDDDIDYGKSAPVSRAMSWLDNGSNAAGSFAGSGAGSASTGEGHSEAGDSEGIGTSAADTHDEDLAVDMRRAKRLKKLHRMLASSIAQAATNHWRKWTLILLAVLFVAHIVCFCVLTTQVQARYANALTVNDIGLAMAYSSQAVLRSNFLQKCNLPQFQNFSLCTPDWIKTYGDKVLKNARLFKDTHLSLYLGRSGLEPFTDQRLLNFWTYTMLPEMLYYDRVGNTSKVLLNSTRTLWEMGNFLVSSLDEVYYNRAKWTSTMSNQPAWQYVYQNGPESIFKGYAWSLDTFVDFTWRDLTNLSVTFIILLVLEAVVVQLSCMGYEGYLLHKCNTSHMRLFSVFLALPSATVRFMARRPLVVDDDTNDDLEDDDLELVEGTTAAGAAATEAGGANTERKKSVRMAAEASDEDEGEGGGKSKGKKPIRPITQSRSKAVNILGKARHPTKGFAAFRRKLYKNLFGWLDPKFKCSGKKLVPSHQVLARFMVPLLLWVAAVTVIYGVSYDKLQGLQGPLASLDLSTHVRFRMTRSRLIANQLAFSETDTDNAYYRAQLVNALALLKQEYTTLLYGGQMLLSANVSFDATAPAAATSDASIADLFFKTTSCLRADQSTCFQPGDQYYDITHSGLDAQIQKYIDQMSIFANLPDSLAYANHTSYVFTAMVSATDTYDGLQTAARISVEWTLSRLESVRQLHIILLVISVCCMVLFVLVLYRPYSKLLHSETKAVVNMLSQLPAEVDVEGHVKSIVLGIVKAEGSSKFPAAPSMAIGLGGSTGPFGMPCDSNVAAMGMMVPAGGPGMKDRFAAGPGAERGGAGSSWFGRRTSNNTVPQADDGRMYGFGMYHHMNYESMA